MRFYGSLRLASLAGAAAVLAACSTLSSIFGGESADLALGGYDPVAYFITGTPVLGSRDIQVTHNGGLYSFSSDENRRLFITSPTRYAPQYDGFSAGKMVYAIPEPGEPGVFKIIDGKLYLFTDPRDRLYFEMDQERNLRLASQYWESEVKNSTWQVQHWKRMVFRVPHYKSDTELAEEYQRRFGRKPG
jgi:YHS domain-containing protein